MTDRLQELWDHHQIRQLLATYCHGCDRADEVLMASTYAQDSWDDHGPRKMPGGRFSFETVEESIAATRVVSHLLGQSLVTLDGDQAGAETYFIATVVYPQREAGGGEMLNQLGGRYVDTLVRESGDWLIKTRVCVREWSYSQPIERDWLAGKGFVETQRGQADISNQALELTLTGTLFAGAP